MSSDYGFALVAACLRYSSLSAGDTDYHALGTLQLTLEPGNQSLQSSVIIVNNIVVENYQEKFTLHLQTNQRTVNVKDAFSNTTVTILDDDSKQFKCTMPTVY